jgi:hypothetical protein
MHVLLLLEWHMRQAACAMKKLAWGKQLVSYNCSLKLHETNFLKTISLVHTPILFPLASRLMMIISEMSEL